LIDGPRVIYARSCFQSIASPLSLYRP
jgi:hypothetical protein